MNVQGRYHATETDRLCGTNSGVRALFFLIVDQGHFGKIPHWLFVQEEQIRYK